MALAKHAELIDQRRLENGARFAYEYQYPQPINATVRSPWLAGPRAEKGPGTLSAARRAEIRKYVRKLNDEIEARLERERALVCSLNSSLTRIMGIEFLTKREAAARAGGVLAISKVLDLDYIYGGALRVGDHLFFSEKRVHSCLVRKNYEVDPVDLVQILVRERPVYAD